MIRKWVLCLGLAGILPLPAQDELSIDDLLQEGRAWAEENLDERVLKSLDQIDDTKLGSVLRDLQRRFEGEYVLDLAALRETAVSTLPLLEANEETRPYLHSQFKNWPLSVAAYNCGEGRLRTVMSRHKAKTFEAISPRLPAETQLYVPKIEAIVQRREGKVLSDLPGPSR